jgi:hypothetical protein
MIAPAKREDPSLLQCISHSVIGAAAGILDLAFGLVRTAAGAQIVIAGCLAESFLYRALKRFRQAGDSVLIQRYALLASPQARDKIGNLVAFESSVGKIAGRTLVHQLRK